MVTRYDELIYIIWSINAIVYRRRMEQELLDAKRTEREKKEQHRIKMVELKHNLDLQIHQRDQGIKAFNGLSAVETVMNKVSEWVDE